MTSAIQSSLLIKLSKKPTVGVHIAFYFSLLTIQHVVLIMLIFKYCSNLMKGKPGFYLHVENNEISTRNSEKSN